MAVDQTSLAPGFRFHPTDEELVSYYLKRKICGKPFRFDFIAEVDIYKSEPMELPDKSRLKSKDLEWYFFSVLDRKYGNGSRMNRATERGYWKTTGNDKPVLHKCQTVGMKKTLVYHIGRAPQGERSNWVMHEYRLIDEQLEKTGHLQDAFVLCRIFQKSGSGPKNGEQYGAPFVEEEWDDNELVMVPGKEAAQEVAIYNEDSVLNGDDIDQIFGVNLPSEEVSPPFSFYFGDNSSNDQANVDFVGDAENLLLPEGGSYCSPEQCVDGKLFDLPVQSHVEAVPVETEYTGESRNTVISVDAGFLLDEPYFDAPNRLDEPYFDAPNNFPFGYEEFLEINDLSNPIGVDLSGFDALREHFTFLEPDLSNSQDMTFDAPIMMESENTVNEQANGIQEPVIDGAQQESVGSHHLSQGHDNDRESSTNQKPAKSGSDAQSSAMKKASRMLGDIDAPPAFASEFPSKAAGLVPGSASLSANPDPFKASKMEMGNMDLVGKGRCGSFGKNEKDSFVLPFTDANSASLGKVGSVMARGWFYLFFGWAMILSVTVKIGSYVYSGKTA